MTRYFSLFSVLFPWSRYFVFVHHFDFLLAYKEKTFLIILVQL